MCLKADVVLFISPLSFGAGFLFYGIKKEDKLSEQKKSISGELDRLLAPLYKCAKGW
jgi:hypothetical protein